MSDKGSGLDAAVDKVIASIDQDELEGRYPNRTHFVPADHPQQAEMATKALFEGDPVVIVYPDGREVLLTPQHAAGVAGLLLLLATIWLRWSAKRHGADVIQLPPRTRIEARDSSGIPAAA